MPETPERDRAVTFRVTVLLTGAVALLPSIPTTAMAVSEPAAGVPASHILLALQTG